MSVVRLEGMVDPHVHLRGMDWAHKATFATETRAALAGGYWAVLDMPNTEPATITPEALRYKRDAISREAVCDWGLYYGADASDNSTTFTEVHDKVCGLKIYNNATTGNLLIDDQSTREAMYAHWPATTPIAVHAEDETVLAILELVRRYRKPTHFVHICTALEIKLLRAAKEEGLPVTIGVTPHHLFLTEADDAHLGAYGRMKPGLKTASDQVALWRAIADGVVDIIESDHAPHTRAEKDSDAPPYGVPGLETTLPLMLQAVYEGRLSLEQLIPMVTTTVHNTFGLRVPPETYTEVDLTATFTVQGKHMHGNCKWTPFEGMPARGRVQGVWIRGKRAFDGEQILVEHGFGQQIL